jgi:hypothetical protein
MTMSCAALHFLASACRRRRLACSSFLAATLPATSSLVCIAAGSYESAACAASRSCRRTARSGRTRRWQPFHSARWGPSPCSRKSSTQRLLPRQLPALAAPVVALVVLAAAAAAHRPRRLLHPRQARVQRRPRMCCAPQMLTRGSWQRCSPSRGKAGSAARQRVAGVMGPGVTKPRAGAAAGDNLNALRLSCRLDEVVPLPALEAGGATRR